METPFVFEKSNLGVKKKRREIKSRSEQKVYVNISFSEMNGFCEISNIIAI